MSRKLKGKSGYAAMVLQLQNHGSGSAAERRTMVLVLQQNQLFLVLQQNQNRFWDLSNNKLTGKIPELFSELPSLKFLESAHRFNPQITEAKVKYHFVVEVCFYTISEPSHGSAAEPDHGTGSAAEPWLLQQNHFWFCRTKNQNHGSAAQPRTRTMVLQQNQAMVLQQNQTMELVLQQNHFWFCCRTISDVITCAAAAAGNFYQEFDITWFAAEPSHGSVAEPDHGTGSAAEPFLVLNQNQAMVLL
ncbi:uncharacterized protein G2W53_004009 [Senna tora]|uniref:Uncharacterized protein n=1 Tax=Senna tora TaxID=362788 RepID=A0A835CHM3_9FABA|nr:uncharacterized protein G2W53_004009 [Senna tora]